YLGERSRSVIILFLAIMCVFLTGTHNISQRAEQRQLFPTEGRDIIIGEGVWIATNATIIGPCSIGDDAVIAAGAVVVDNIEAGWLYAGVPARKVKRLI
ncbi:hypothetical protein JS562_54220, partial [Agrobacterium sp. S2]|nr:hypothetical protein [Agrobacterium sp. S2]